MGNSQKLPSELPIGAMIRRIDECLTATDREGLASYLDMLDVKLQLSKTPEQDALEFREGSGVPVAIKIMKRMMGGKSLSSTKFNLLSLSKLEELIFRTLMMILGAIKADVGVSTDIIQQGGVDFLSKALREYSSHDFLPKYIQEYLKVILISGSSVAINEIKKESTYLRLCRKCQEVVEREIMLETGVISNKIPRSIDRINRILMFMTNYSVREDVQCAGLDAILTFSKNG